jgi:hypothetical protein
MAGLSGGAVAGGLLASAGMIAVFVWDAERAKLRKKLAMEMAAIKDDEMGAIFGDKKAQQRLDARRNRGGLSTHFAGSGGQEFAALTASRPFITASELVERAGGTVGQYQMQQMGERTAFRTAVTDIKTALQSFSDKAMIIQLDGRTIYENVLGRVEAEAGRS